MTDLAPRPKRKKPVRRSSFGRMRKERSGRWSAAYPHLGQLHRAPTTFSAKIDAAAWLAAERRLIETDSWSPPAVRAAARSADAGITLSEYATKWIKTRTLTRLTRDNYQCLLDLHIEPVLGDTPLRSLTPEQVRDWFAGLGSAHPTRNARAYGVLSAVLNTAADDGLIDKSPARIRGAAVAKHADRTVVLLTPDELDQLAEKMPEPLRLTVVLAGWLGLRRGELFALTRADVGEGGATVSVTKAVSRRRGITVVGPPKTVGSRRTVTVPPHLRDAIEDHLDRHVGPEDEALLFPDPATGEHCTEGRFRGPFDAAKAAIGKPDLHLHDLRHFGGVMAAQTGATTREVMDRLGHVTTAAAMRYQHVAAGRAETLADRLSALVAPPEQ